MGHCECHTEWDCGKRATAADAMRELLLAWEKYARDMAEAGVVAYPELLGRRTVGLLDATAV